MKLRNPTAWLAALALLAPDANAAPPADAGEKPTMVEQIQGGLTQRYDKMQEQLDAAESIPGYEKPCSPPDKCPGRGGRAAMRPSASGDPTRATPEFEKMFHDLSRGQLKGGADNAAPAAAAPRPRPPKVNVVGRVSGSGTGSGTVLLKIDEETLMLRPGQKASVLIGDQHVDVTLEKHDGAIQLQLHSPYNTTVRLF